LHDEAKRRALAAAQYTQGLWGDKAAVEETLGRLAEGLAGDWILDEQDAAVVGSMCAITLSRGDLSCRERNELHERVLHLVADWLQGPSEQRRVAYPFLDAAGSDEELPAYLRNMALSLLTAQAQECVQYLLGGAEQSPAWLSADEALGPGLTRLLERIEWLELLRSALGLIPLQALAGTWRTRLIKLSNLAGVELATAIEQDPLLAAHSEAYLLLAELLGESWLTPPAAKRISPIVDAYLDDLRATMELYTGVTVVHRPIYDEVAALLTLTWLSPTLRLEISTFLNIHEPLEDV
jgi:hypothetical protein